MINAYMLRAMSDELEKTAFVGGLGKALVSGASRVGNVFSDTGGKAVGKAYGRLAGRLSPTAAGNVTARQARQQGYTRANNLIGGTALGVAGLGAAGIGASMAGGD